jgi:flagellin
MALVVNTNMNALTIENTLSATNNKVSSSLKKLSSGLRINSAADDPAGYAIANSFKSAISSMTVASQNASEAESMLEVADGAYSTINDILEQMKTLATEASSGQESQTNLDSLNAEFSDLQNEINLIAKSTTYGSTHLIDGTNSTATSGITFQIGATNSSNDQITIKFDTATTSCLGVSSISIDSQTTAESAMDAIDSALTSINTYMGSVGGLTNQLTYTVTNLTTSIQNYTSSESTIEDVDMASEVSTLTKNEILQQSATAMLAQANSQPQQILKLLS